MTKEILDKLNEAIKSQLTIEHLKVQDRHIIVGTKEAAQAALEVIEEYVVFLDKGADSKEILERRIERMGHRIQELEYKLLPTSCKPACRGFIYKNQQKKPCSRTSEFDGQFCYSHRNQKRNGKPVVTLGE